MIFKIIKISLLLIFIASFSSKAVPLPEAPSIKSDSYYLMDYDTGEVLLSKNENTIYPPASLTKLMTVYTLLEEIKRGVVSKDDYVKISEKAFNTAKRHSSSRMFLEINDKVLLSDLMKGLIVQSGNDAAIAIAEHVSGTEENFSKMMNYYAKSIGMKNSNFRNASGLPYKNHYTTSKDLAVLMRKMITEFPEDYKYYFSIKEFEYNNINQASRNKLLFRDSNVEGGKTGWTRNANYCYIASFTEKNRRLIVATLSAPKPEDRFNDAIALTNYGFKFYENYYIVEKDKPIVGMETLPVYRSDIKNVRIAPKNDINLTILTGVFEGINVKIELKDILIAPIKLGTEVGKIKVFKDQEIIEETSIITKEDVKEGLWYENIIDEIYLKFIENIKES